ncbi:HEAT repeat domain-containing protein [Gracilimonas sp.]|uniref:HEAT repeat domain-containing protein n=1 Tax=Gracilimonas sp. TaxID=1974203 RepID=UPI0028716D7D|nr:HEAT repeat domain-containing protein [Gracilimonas sp.]
MNKNYEQLIADYISGNLEQAGKNRVEELIANGEIDFTEFRELEKMYDDLDTISTPKPSDELSTRFYTMLEKEKKAKAKSWSEYLIHHIQNVAAEITMPRLAYTVVLLLIGGFAGTLLNNNNQTQIEQLSQEMQAMKEMMMVNMLEGSSAADRLKAVNISTELPSADTEAIQALLFTLNKDSSVNVRVQAIEALKRLGDNEYVREGLVRSIAKQESPIVIIELADAMIELELKNGASEFERLLQEREFDYTVEQKLQSSIAVLM